MPRYEPVQSVMRALDILELIGASEKGIALWHIRRTTGLKYSTVYNLLRTLMRRGFVEQLRNPIRFRLGQAYFSLPRMSRDRDLLLRGGTIARDVSRKADAEVFIGEYIAGEILAFLRMPVEGEGIALYTGGWLLDAYGTGLVFQAYWSEEQRREYQARHPLAKHVSPLGKTQRQVDKGLRKIRDQGYLLIRHDNLVVAAPIFGPDGQVRALIAMAKPLSQTTKAHEKLCVELICAAAGELSSPAGLPNS